MNQLKPSSLVNGFIAADWNEMDDLKMPESNSHLEAEPMNRPWNALEESANLLFEGAEEVPWEAPEDLPFEDVEALRQAFFWLIDALESLAESYLRTQDPRDEALRYAASNLISSLEPLKASLSETPPPQRCECCRVVLAPWEQGPLYDSCAPEKWGFSIGNTEVATR
jgi:hypothetical protein